MSIPPIQFNNLIKFGLMLAMLVSLWWLVQPTLAASTNDDNILNDLQSLSPHAQCANHITVTSNGDSGAGTLRQALVDICDGGTIDFHMDLANDTITTSSQLNISKTVTITNPDASDLKISGNDAHRVFYIQSGTVVTMSGFSVISGTLVAGFSYCPNACGSGIWIDTNAAVLLDSIILSDNRAHFHGGGIFNQGALTLNNVTFTGNVADSSGGGIANHGSLYVSRSVFDNNAINYFDSTGDRAGGGIYNFGTLAITGTTFTNNGVVSTHTYGGGIHNSGTLVISDTTFRNNHAGAGAGLYNLNTLTVEDSSFIENSTAGWDGGGLYNSNYGKLTVLTNVIFNSNEARDGGGIYNDWGTIRIQDSTIMSNTASFDGGGLYNALGTATVENSTVSNNFGSGIHSDTSIARLILNNTTISGNQGYGIDSYQGNITATNTIIANSSNLDCSVSFGMINTNLSNLIEDGSCSPALYGDPNLGPLQDNGGDILTQALLPGSLAINVGDNATCLTTDQRGITRPQEGQCDIGAFESQGFALSISGGNNQTTPIGSAFDSPLDLTITSNSGDEPVDGGIINFTAPDSGPSTSFAPTTTATIASGSVSLDVSANTFAGGPYNVVASANGSNAVNFSLTNAKITPMVAVDSFINPSLFGQTVIFTATVSSSITTPTGNITFIIDGTPQSSGTLLNGQAVFSTSSLAVGNHTVVAYYSGDSNFNANGDSLAGGQTVLINNNAPYIPSSPVPADGGTNVSTTQMLSWQGGDPDGDVVTYAIAFGTNNPPSVVETTNLTSYMPSLISGTTYYWMVTATDGISESAGPMWSFATEAVATTDTKFVYLPIVLK